MLAARLFAAGAPGRLDRQHLCDSVSESHRCVTPSIVGIRVQVCGLVQPGLSAAAVKKGMGNAMSVPCVAVVLNAVLLCVKDHTVVQRNARVCGVWVHMCDVVDVVLGTSLSTLFVHGDASAAFTQCQGEGEAIVVVDV